MNQAMRGVRPLLMVIMFAASFVGRANGFDVPEMDSQKYPIEVYGDYLEYRTKANQVVTKGNAFIVYKDMKIRADTIQSNTKNEDIFAQGKVDFWKAYDQTTGDLLVYNMKNGKGWIRDATVRKNRNFFKAKDVYVSPAYSLAKNIIQSTCENEDHPHYRLTAKQIEIIPGQSMTMEDLRGRWKGTTLYKKKLDKSNLFDKDGGKFFTTRQGMSQIDGFYMKVSTGLEVTPKIKSDVVYDYFAKRGNGVGLTGSYAGTGASNGTFSLYKLDESKYSHSNTQMNLAHNYRFKGGSSLSSNFAYTGDQTVGNAENQDLNVQFNYTTQLKFASVNMTMSKYYDLDGSRYALDNQYQVLNRVPEVNLSFPAYTFPLLPITANVSGMMAQYEEGTLDAIRNTNKRDMRSNFTVPTVQVNRRFDFTPSYNYERNWYSIGETRETGTTMVRANQKFSKTTNLEFNYNISTQKGESPFRFDSMTTIDMLSTRLRFTEGNWTFNPVNFNYNRAAGRLEQVYWDYSLRSAPDAYHNWEFFMRRDYVPDPVPFGSMALTRLTPSNLNLRYRIASLLWSFDTSLTYPHEYRRVTDTSFNYRTTIRPLWQISTNGHYSHINEKFSPLTVGLIRDLHCWEARAEYNIERKEFWIEFYLKAYPEDAGRFRYGADTNRLEAKFATFDQMTQGYDSFRGPR
ncbi:MAG: LptA/OstA family protein [Candidatus Ozemobacteraceae bacterium]